MNLIDGYFMNFYDINNIRGYDVSESSGVRPHGKRSNFYKGVLIPIIDSFNIDTICIVHHLPDTYVKKNEEAKRLNIPQCCFSQLSIEHCVYPYEDICSRTEIP